MATNSQPWTLIETSYHLKFIAATGSKPPPLHVHGYHPNQKTTIPITATINKLPPRHVHGYHPNQTTTIPITATINKLPPL
jgi:hypothetical protein